MSKILLLVIFATTILIWFLNIRFKRIFIFFSTGVIVFFILFPNNLTIIARYFDIGRGTDLLVYLQFMMIVYLYLSIFEVRKNQEKLRGDFVKSETINNSRRIYPNWFS
jgi:hypothetical protein